MRHIKRSSDSKVKTEKGVNCTVGAQRMAVKEACRTNCARESEEGVHELCARYATH